MSESTQSYFSSTIGKKQIMALTGIFLWVFVVVHLLGNLTLLLGADAFNTYAHTLTKNKAILYVAEAGLITLFLSHIFLAINLRIRNKMARPQGYYVHKFDGKGATFASRSMVATGPLILVFVIGHLINFKFGAYYEASIDGVIVRDIYRTVIEYFSNPLYVTWYVACMLVLGFHLRHGFWSAFHTLGVSHKRYNGYLKTFSHLSAYAIALGFSGLAIFCYFQN